AFFFATVYIFVDEFFPKDARASAQGLFNFLIIGIGPLAGNFLWPFLKGEFTEKVDGVDVVNYQALFLVPSGTALFAALLLLFFFHPPRSAKELGGDDDSESPFAAAPRGETGIKVMDTGFKSD